MVHRKKDFSRPPSGLVDSKWDTLKSNLLVEQHNHNVNDACYRDTTIEALSLLYNDKCSVCERQRGTELQVDHYRAKKTRNHKTNIHYNQPGYYWLAYTWSNLLPLCSKCNNNKSNKFPLAGWTHTNRVTSHINTSGLSPFLPYDLNWLQNRESPLIINPEHETNPEKHFVFLKDGSIKGRTPEGIETINVFQLNRKDLRRERIKIRQDYVIAIKEAFDDFSNHKNADQFKGELIATFRRIKRNIHIDEAHSLYHVFMYKYFNYFVATFFPETTLKPIVIKYFEYFKNK